MRFESILDSIGNTPLVRLRKIAGKKVQVYAKLEKLNPAGSVKDRVALSIVEAAEKSGELKKGKAILEATSGNMGIGIAMVGAAKGYSVKIVMPENMSVERQKILAAYGAEVILSPAEEGTDGSIRVAREMAKDPKYFLSGQFSSQNNPRAHHRTAREVWEDTNGRITHFVAGMGTGGTLMGVSERLKKYNPKIMVIGVEPTAGHGIQGLKNMEAERAPDIYDARKLDDIVQVEDKDAFEAARMLARQEGILAGMSSGAAAHAALKVAEGLDKGLVVAVFPDGGERYLSTGLFELPADAFWSVL